MKVRSQPKSATAHHNHVKLEKDGLEDRVTDGGHKSHSPPSIGHISSS